MNTTADRIELRGLRLLGRHGVFEFEKTQAQPFEIDLDLETDIRTPGRSDNIDDTVSYVDVIDVVTRIVENEQHDLLERLATRITEDVLLDTRITSVDVTVRKLRPAVTAQLTSSAVRIRRP